MVSSNVRWLDTARMRLRSLGRRRRAEEELEDELRFHFDSVVERLVAQGMGVDAARRKARLEIGGAEQIKEGCRDARGLAPLENFVRDLAYAWRGFRKAPGFTLTATGAIALGVGANAALFTILYGMALRPLPVKDPGSMRNIFLETQGTGSRGQYGSLYFVSYEEFNYLRDHARTAELAAVAEQKLSWRGARGRPLYAELVSANLLPLIGGRPVLGRFFSAREVSHPGSAPVAVLSYAAWQRYFGGALDVAGRKMVLNRTPFTIIGVADPTTGGPLITRPDLWVPYTMQAVLRPAEALIGNADMGWLQVIGRLKRDSTGGQMQAEMQVLGQQAVAAHGSQRKARVTVAPGAFLNSPQIMTAGVLAGGVLLLAVSLVLLVACSNVANMLLARGLSRRREFAIRLSIGAGKGRLLQQLLSESLLLSVLGGALGLALAQTATRLMVAAVPSDAGPFQLDLNPDWRILLYTLAVSLGAGLLFGFFPALNLLRSNLTPALKSQGLDASSMRRRFRLQDALIAVQVAACLILLVNAGLLLRGFRAALKTDTGQALRNVLVASFDLKQQQYTEEKAERFATAVRNAAAAMPGVRAASLTTNNPFLSTCVTGANVISAAGSAGPAFPASCDHVGLDYFRTMHIAMRQGRTFNAADLQGRPKFAIVDERLARRYFAGNAVGRRIRMGEQPEDEREIIGVAAATRNLGLDANEDPLVYEPLSAKSAGDAVLLVDYYGPPQSLMRAIEKSVTVLDPEVTPSIQPIEHNVNYALMPQKLGAAAASTLGGLGLLLACTGVYGVVAFAVNRRRREVGIRMALGAEQNDVLRLLLWQAFKPVIAGAAFGLALAAAAAQLIRAMLYGVSPFDPVAFGSTAAILALMALLAAAVPARAALRVDPAVTLRHD